MRTRRTTGQNLSDRGCPETSETMAVLLPVCAISAETKTSKARHPEALSPKIPRSFTSDLQATLSRVFSADGEIHWFPRRCSYYSYYERALVAQK